MNMLVGLDLKLTRADEGKQKKRFKEINSQ